MEYDVLIIGAGVTGCAIAQQVAQLDLKTAVLEKELDVCEGTSKANSGIVHAGYDALPGTLKARFNVRGAELIPVLAQQLGFGFRNTGSLVLCLDEAGRDKLEELKRRGQTNGVPGLEILEREEVLQREPHANPAVTCALWAPTAGIVDPFGMTVALADNAAENGTEFLFGQPVQRVERVSMENGEPGWLVNGTYKTRILVNAAGCHAGEIHELACQEPLRIRPRKGEYFLFDREAGSLASCVLFPLPTDKGKGVLVTPTVHGNLLAGPTAEFTEDPQDTATTRSGLADVQAKAGQTLPELPWRQVITSFAGLRAVPDGGDFIVQESAPAFIDAAGIESPGLTSAPAIGEYVAALVREQLQAAEKAGAVKTRRPFVNLNEITPQEWNDLIRQNPAYGQIVCRCETIVEGQILDACTRPVPARTLDGVKRRVRAGMGRCQGGFCSPRVMEILAQVQNADLAAIRKSGPGSVIITGEDKEDLA